MKMKKIQKKKGVSCSIWHFHLRDKIYDFFWTRERGKKFYYRAVVKGGKKKKKKKNKKKKKKKIEKRNEWGGVTWQTQADSAGDTRNVKNLK